MLFMSSENSKEERIKQLKRLKTTLLAVLELRKEFENQDEQVEIAQVQSQELLTSSKQRHVSRARTLRKTRKTLRELSPAARRRRTYQMQEEEKKKPKIIVLYVR